MLLRKLLDKPSSQDAAVRRAVKQAEKLTAHTFSNPELLEEALTHPSARGPQHAHDYERMEFLGDAILGAVVANDLYHRFPELNEGRLTIKKTAVVAGSVLAQVAQEIGLGECIIFGPSEKSAHAQGYISALENVYEAVCAALFLDAGIEAVRTFVLATLADNIEHAPVAEPNPKSHLQGIVQHLVHKTPVYEIVEQSGPAHDPTFVAQVLLDSCVLATGQGTTKKLAESAAAANAVNDIEAAHNQHAYLIEFLASSNTQHVKDR